jgi:hypothetical protein
MNCICVLKTRNYSHANKHHNNKKYVDILVFVQQKLKLFDILFILEHFEIKYVICYLFIYIFDKLSAGACLENKHNG